MTKSEKIIKFRNLTVNFSEKTEFEKYLENFGDFSKVREDFMRSQ